MNNLFFQSITPTSYAGKKTVLIKMNYISILILFIDLSIMYILGFVYIQYCLFFAASSFIDTASYLYMTVQPYMQ